ncbi:transposase [Streptomyces sp. NPDC006365]|uniref:transposase n=1 Tax=Streptomyces sp. NPDC006365 TaxID=3364744 RepID=UPI0036975E6D
MPEVWQVATIIDRWRLKIEAFIGTGHHNAMSEGINRMIKLVVRAAFGFHKAECQRLRTRCDTIRRAHGHLRRL